MMGVVANHLGHLIPAAAAVAVGATLPEQIQRLPAVLVPAAPLLALGLAVPSMAFSAGTLLGAAPTI